MTASRSSWGLCECSQEEMGSLFKCTIVFGDSTSETEVSSLNDDLFDYVQMEPKKFFFYVDGVACEYAVPPPCRGAPVAAPA